ncbi:hypothetical protein SAMN02745702_00509 [Desulfobaculum bizertense DSM 18034]|uniref:Uncharacterized protein n=1 Tax=Desulfobaculum bizertense DSM 18034 TaxID=1121442 RepID=A0A1T4VK25_9BACT|nr:hypothetical protein SAMN02745702_00509 [Desulfobaculum bizertense DSM 18034]
MKKLIVQFFHKVKVWIDASANFFWPDKVFRCRLARTSFDYLRQTLEICRILKNSFWR